MSDPSAAPASPDELDKSNATIKTMFGGVARRYDLLNRLLSGYMDVYWRRRAAKSLAPRSGERILDLCCGTGDQALAIRKAASREQSGTAEIPVGGGAPEIVAADFCLPMLALARRKFERLEEHRPALSAGDALRLPLPDRYFDAASVSFGIRNVANVDLALREMARVLKPGGRLMVLEATIPDGILRRPYLFYFLKVLPAIARWISDRASAYEYLPESVVAFPQREAFLERMGAAGLVDTHFRALTVGTVCIYQGRRPE